MKGRIMAKGVPVERTHTIPVWSAKDEIEPIPRDSPLLGLDSCVITPHAAWYSDESSAALQRLAAEEAVRLLRGEPPRCPVNRLE